MFNVIWGILKPTCYRYRYFTIETMVNYNTPYILKYIFFWQFSFRIISYMVLDVIWGKEIGSNTIVNRCLIIYWYNQKGSVFLCSLYLCTMIYWQIQNWSVFACSLKISIYFGKMILSMKTNRVDTFSILKPIFLYHLYNYQEQPPAVVFIWFYVCLLLRKRKVVKCVSAFLFAFLL